MAATWEDLAQKYGQPQGGTPVTSDGWDALRSKYAQPDQSTHPDGAVKVDEPANAKSVSLMDRVRAGAAGINKGFYSDLIGMPVDTAANVLDLGKAGFGYLTSKITGQAPPDWTMPYDRSEVPGTSEWIGNQMEKGGLGGAIDNPNPQDPLSRVLYSGGRVGGASVVPFRSMPISAGRQALNIAGGVTSGLAAGATGEFLPDYAGVAGMLPQLVSAGTVAGFKGAIRGGEAGRRDMGQRLQDFKNGGVNAPSVGLASGNGFVQGIENLLSQTPGSMGVFQRSREAMQDGMQNRTNQIRDSISPTYGAQEAGAAIQDDLKGPFKDRVSGTYGLLNDRVESLVGPNTIIPVNESIRTSGYLSAPTPGAQATSSNFINSRIAKINSDLTSDASPAGGVPFSAVKSLRTRIGQEAASKNIMATPQEGEWKQLYGAMSDDISAATRASDVANNPVTMPATNALNRANDYYGNAMKRIDNLNTLANRNTPESAYNSVATSLQSGPTTYARVRNAVRPETRQKIAATVIDDLGRAKPGQQTADGDAWSPATFLTNYNKLDQSGKQALFTRLPGGKQHAENLADIAKAAEMIGQGSKVWSNPSGTGAALAARGTFGAIGVGALFKPFVAGTAAGGLALGHVASRLLVSPIFANWLAKASKVPPAQMQAYAQRLIVNAKFSGDQQMQQDVAQYLQSVDQPAQ